MKRLIFTCLLFFTAAQLFAQNGSLGMYAPATQPFDTVIYGGTIDVPAAIVNTDSTQTFIGSAVAVLAVFFQGSLIPVDTVSFDSIAMVPGETTDFAFSFASGSGNGFAVGLNHMYAWPLTSVAPVTDTLQFDLLAVPDPYNLLTIGPGNLMYPDSVPLNSDVSFQFELRNNSIVPLASELDIKIGVASALGVETVDSLHFDMLTMTAGETQLHAFADIGITYDNGFNDGGNIVLIWPEAPDAGAPSDSLSIPITVTDELASVGKTWDGYSKLRLFPNPTTNGILTIVTGNSLPAQRVVISDVNGRTLLTATNTNSVSVEELPAGVYIATVALSDDKVRAFRLVRK